MWVVGRRWLFDYGSFVLWVGWVGFWVGSWVGFVSLIRVFIRLCVRFVSVI